MTTSPQHEAVLADVTLLNVERVAGLLGVHPRSVWRMAQTGEIPRPIRLGERVVRWRLSDLREHLEQRVEGTNRGRR